MEFLWTTGAVPDYLNIRERQVPEFSNIREPQVRFFIIRTANNDPSLSPHAVTIVYLMYKYRDLRY